MSDISKQSMQQMLDNMVSTKQGELDQRVQETHQILHLKVCECSSLSKMSVEGHIPYEHSSKGF